LKYTGFTFVEPERNIAPTVYVDWFLETIERGDITMQDAVDKIARIYEEHREDMPGIDENFAPDREYILERVEHRLVSKELNKTLLGGASQRFFGPCGYLQCCCQS
jgi:hypothetical protein